MAAALETTHKRLYNFRNMECTDPDTLQFGRELSEGRWYYVQVRDDDILERFGGHTEEFIKAYENDSDVTHVIDSNLGMYAGDVDLSDFYDKEIGEFIQPYGYTLRNDSRDSVERMYGDSWKQICCECIFEQLMFSDYRLDC